LVLILRQDKVFCIGENCRKSTGVDEDNGVVFLDDPFLDMIDQACHGFTGVYWIEENSFGFSYQFQGISPSLSCNAVSLTNVVI